MSVFGSNSYVLVGRGNGRRSGISTSVAQPTTGSPFDGFKSPLKSGSQISEIKAMSVSLGSRSDTSDSDNSDDEASEVSRTERDSDLLVSIKNLKALIERRFGDGSTKLSPNERIRFDSLNAKLAEYKSLLPDQDELQARKTLNALPRQTL